MSKSVNWRRSRKTGDVRRALGSDLVSGSGDVVSRCGGRIRRCGERIQKRCRGCRDGEEEVGRRADVM